MKKYELVVQRLQSLVDNGTLPPGQRAPSVRSMADQMGLSLMTVLDAYRRLEDMGLLAARERSGYFVRPKQFWRSAPAKQLELARPEWGRFTARSVKLDDGVTTLLEQAARPGVVPLGAGVPNPKFLPSERMSISMARVVRRDPLGVNRYSFAPGERVLRQQLALRLLESGCTVSEDDVMITTGASDALTTALRGVTQPGDTIAIESPGYFGFYCAAQFLNLKVVEVPSDPQAGVMIDQFQRLLCQKAKIRCLLLCPCISNPTGAAMPDDNKQMLVDCAREAGVTLIEDDTYGELFFSDHRSRALKAFGDDVVIQIGGLGKTLCPGYRIGWVSGGRHHETIQQLHGISHIGVPTPNQLAVADYLAHGGMAKHLRKIRAIYQEHVDLFRMTIADCFPSDTRVGDPAGGHFLWIQMPEQFDSVALAQAAICKNVSIAPGVLFSLGQRYRSSFRLNCAVPWTAEVEKALRSLGKLCTRFLTQ